MVKNIYCKRCGHKVIRETCKELKKIYPFYCANCDEDMFRFETYKKDKRWLEDVKKVRNNNSA